MRERDSQGTYIYYRGEGFKSLLLDKNLLCPRNTPSQLYPKEAKAKIPHIVIDFYEEKLNWFNDPADSQDEE